LYVLLIAYFSFSCFYSQKSRICCSRSLGSSSNIWAWR